MYTNLLIEEKNTTHVLLLDLNAAFYRHFEVCNDRNNPY